MRDGVDGVSDMRQAPGRDWNGIENIPEPALKSVRVFGWYFIDQA
jgi:hypothetical protein